MASGLTDLVGFAAAELGFPPCGHSVMMAVDMIRMHPRIREKQPW